MSPDSALDLDSLRIEGQRFSSNLADAITDIELERTIEGVTTITVDIKDTHRRIVNSPLLQARSVLSADADAGYELAAIKKTEEQFKLVFEDVMVAMLRRKLDPRSTEAGSITRSAWVRMLVGEIHGTVQGPDSPAALGDPQSTLANPPTAATAVDPASPDGTVPAPFGVGDVIGGGLPGGVGAAIAGTSSSTDTDTPVPAGGEGTQYTPAQIAAVHASVGFSGQALVTIVAISLAESGGRSVTSKPNDNGTVDRGIDQINSVHSQYDPEQLISDPYYNAQAAFEISGGGGNFTPWTTFWTSDPKRSYKGHLAEAEEGVANMGTSGSIAAPVTATGTQATGSSGGKPSDWWTALKRTADEVQWRIFCDKGVFWFVPDGWLIARDPAFTITERSPGVDWIDFDFDVGKPIATAKLAARASLWAVAPGAVIVVEEMGIVSGRWLVKSVRTSPFRPTAYIELIQPTPALPEPAHQAFDDTAEGAAGAANAEFPIDPGSWMLYANPVERMVAFALTKEGGPYVWGGNGPEGYDCSGLVSASVLAADRSAHLERQTTLAWNQCNDAGTVIPIAEGINTRGAILWQLPGGPHGSDHMAISLGDGQTIEAMSSKYNPHGIRKGAADRFEVAALVPRFVEAGNYPQVGSGGGGGGGGGGW